jgi:SAM-dependent methyltransferase
MTDPVRDLYEALPYPERDPADESKRLLRTWLDDLPMLNHYGFAGRRAFGAGFRVLVAGGGTGDATVFLAEQLKAVGAEVVHLEVSATSLGIAKRRAEARGLANVEWVHASLLDLHSLGLGAFDYINCVGVLHHLEDPDAGVRALLGSLASGGALGLMVYGTLGRAGIYPMQELLAIATDGLDERRDRVHAAREILGSVPPTNWFRRGEDLYADHRLGDASFADLLLHPRDRSYSVEELYAWLVDGHGLHLSFTDVQRGRYPYEPQYLAGPKPPRALERVLALPLRRRQAFAELFSGTLQTHSFFATRGSAVAPYGDPEFVPFFFHEPVTGPQLAQILASGRGQRVVLDHVHSGLRVAVSPGRHGPAILREIDGRASWGEIFAKLRSQGGHAGTPLTDAGYFEDFRPIYDVLNAIERLLLRHRSVAA